MKYAPAWQQATVVATEDITPTVRQFLRRPVDGVPTAWDDGRGGSRAMWALQPGDTLPVSGPHNHFGLNLSASAYLLVAGGIGITPLVAMAQQLAAHAGAKGVPVRNSIPAGLSPCCRVFARLGPMQDEVWLIYALKRLDRVAALLRKLFGC